MSERIELCADGTRLAVAVRGAEPQSLIGPDGHEYFWQAGPSWPRHAPILFPAICRHPDDLLNTNGQKYPLGHHGFARDLNFTVSSHGHDHATFTLEDTPETRRQYPFRFRLDVSYHLDQTGVMITFQVQNPGTGVLPFGIGSHPAFNWPLEPGESPEEHIIVFDRLERETTRRTHDNLLLPETFAEPSLTSGRMTLRPERFTCGALILEKVRSSSLQYRSPSGRAVRLSWKGFEELALWSPDQSGLLCIEPWRGLPAPADWAGDEISRPDLEHLPPQETRIYAYRIDIEAP